jgi:hypothetical protein
MIALDLTLFSLGIQNDVQEIDGAIQTWASAADNQRLRIAVTEFGVLDLAVSLHLTPHILPFNPCTLTAAWVRSHQASLLCFL